MNWTYDDYRQLDRQLSERLEKRRLEQESYRDFEPRRQGVTGKIRPRRGEN